MSSRGIERKEFQKVRENKLCASARALKSWHANPLSILAREAAEAG
jgi:hypothetical protein